MGRAALSLAALLAVAAYTATPRSALAHSTARTPVVSAAVSEGTRAEPADPIPVRAVERTPERDPKPSPPPAGGSLVWLALAVAVAVGATSGIAPRPPRRALAVALTVALVVLSVESSIHGVHHLGDRTAAAECSVAGATAHLAGTVVESVIVEVKARPLFCASLLRPPSGTVTEPFRPDAGRAPPSV
jgi:hypothetical protein